MSNSPMNASRENHTLYKCVQTIKILGKMLHRNRKSVFFSFPTIPNAVAFLENALNSNQSVFTLILQIISHCSLWHPYRF